MHMHTTTWQCLFSTLALLLATTLVDATPTADPALTHSDLVIYTLTNAARLNPQQFRASLPLSSEASSGCIARNRQPLPPLVFNTALARAARAHSTDMRVNGCFGHDSCRCSGEQCGFDARIERAGFEGSTIGENVVQDSTESAFSMMDLWLGSEGHCKGIFNPRFTDLGVGTNRDHSTQDFGGIRGPRPAQGALLSGTHINDLSTLQFMAVTNGDVPVGTRVRLAVNGGPTADMQRMGGGWFQLEMQDRALANQPGCGSYRFEVVTAGGAITQVFPEQESGKSLGIGRGCGGRVFRGATVVSALATPAAAPAAAPVAAPIATRPPALAPLSLSTANVKPSLPSVQASQQSAQEAPNTVVENAQAADQLAVPADLQARANQFIKSLATAMDNFRASKKAAAATNAAQAAAMNAAQATSAQPNGSLPPRACRLRQPHY